MCPLWNQSLRLGEECSDWLSLDHMPGPGAQTYLNHVDRGSAEEVFPRGRSNEVSWEKGGIMLRQISAVAGGSQASRLSLGEA